MAINSNDFLRDENSHRTLCFSNNSSSNSCRLVKINFPRKDSFSSNKSNRSSNKELKSPYLNRDKVHVLSGINEKKMISKRPNNFMSSFPLAISVYKANSDEFKLSKQNAKKVKKSVLTLPNEPVPMPKTCTVSDFNDSEYFNDTNDNSVTKPTKRRPVKRYKRPRRKEKVIEYYDRDARYCSQLNIDLDCSSSEIVNFNGDGEKVSKVSYKSNNSATSENEVWAILKNINKLQFGPPTSQESVAPLKKRRPLIPERKCHNRNDAHIIETCHTEEFAYVSSFVIDNKIHNTCSPSSSCDRVTVIDKQSEHGDIMQQFSQKIFSRLKNGNKKFLKSRKNTEVNKTNAKTINNKISQVDEDVISTVCGDQLSPERHIVMDEMSGISINSKSCHGSVISIETGNETLVNNQNNFSTICNNNKPNKLKSLLNNLHAKVTTRKPNNDSEKRTCGTTKVLPNKGQDVVSLVSKPSRKPRLALTLPNTKLTLAEIKRRLASLKFPIVILGKDQITNRGINIANYEPVQFNGLDQHIWPFMTEWCDKQALLNTQNFRNKQGQRVMNIIKTENPKVINYKVGYLEHDLSVPDIYASIANPRKKSCFIVTNNNTQKLAKEIPKYIFLKPQPMNILRTTKLQCLDKKYTQKAPIDSNLSNLRRLKTVQKDGIVCAGGINQTDYCSPEYKVEGNTYTENRFIKKPYPSSYQSLKQSAAKAKLQSDFVENIIRKIKRGVYYGVNYTDIQCRMKHTETSTQTDVNVLKNAYCQNNGAVDALPCVVVNKRDDPFNSIPGFDKTFNALEIETFSKSQIAVKHCITNVVVHFDIQILSETNSMTQKKKSALCIPIHVKDNQEKLFKCSTSIVNAILPAELCTIVPTMMQNILDTDTELCLSAVTAEKFESKFTNISELTCFENPCMPSLPGLIVSDQVRPMLKGRFQLLYFKNSISDKNIVVSLPSTSYIKHVTGLFPRVDDRVLWPIIQPSAVSNAIKKRFNGINMAVGNNINKTNDNFNCTALQVYEPKNLRIIPSFGFLNPINFINEIVSKWSLNKHFYSNSYKITGTKDTLLRKPLILQQAVSENTLSVATISKVGFISLYEAFKYNDSCAEVTNQTYSIAAHTDNKLILKANIISENNEKDLRKKWKPVKIVRKKSYVKCYRKCNSLSSISSYKSTPLNGISTLDEFCQVLGSNLLSSVLGGCPEKKILEAIKEMRNWITEINPKQALLVLLLINKKDTPNLIRFRPVLLQGIAVNRITKAVELDTEIEVIERENFNKLSKQFEGISYLPASIENQENLLEELYWIAKTTASDYQKTFDESSEQLLKSLLKKRKKLNPSYLRVMARYVGLGLLTPSK